MPTSYSFDAENIDIYAYMNDTLGNEIDWSIESSEYFGLYVLGGFLNSTSVGNAGQYFDVTPYNLYAGNGSSVYVETYYRKLQHVRFQYGIWVPDAYIDDPYNYTLALGIDYCFYQDDTWYKGWKTEIQTHGAGDYVTGLNQWINYTVEHYRFNPTGGEGGKYEPMRQGKMYAYWEGWKGGRDYFQLYTDLWFSSSDRSRMWGARVNSVYFGMVNDALFNLPWLFGDDWRALQGNFTDLTYKGQIMDYDETGWGDQRYTSEIVMVRFWMNLTRPAGDPYFVRVQGYTTQKFNRQYTGQFVGIDDPPIAVTMIPGMTIGGNIFDSLARFFEDFKGTGILAGWGIFVAFLDTAFSFAGWENGFSTIVSWVENLLDMVVVGITYMFDLLVSLFSVMSVWLVLGIERFTSLGTGLVAIYSNLEWIFSEANQGWVDVSQFINPLLPLLPLVYFIWLLDSRTVEGIFRKVSMSWNFIRSILGFFLQIGQYFINLVYGLIESVQW